MFLSLCFSSLIFFFLTLVGEDPFAGVLVFVSRFRSSISLFFLNFFILAFLFIFIFSFSSFLHVFAFFFSLCCDLQVVLNPSYLHTFFVSVGVHFFRQPLLMMACQGSDTKAHCTLDTVVACFSFTRFHV